MFHWLFATAKMADRQTEVWQHLIGCLYQKPWRLNGNGMEARGVRWDWGSLRGTRSGQIPLRTNMCQQFVQDDKN